MKKLASTSELLRDLLSITKDGDWGKDEPRDGFVPYRVIRGGDFPATRIGDVSSVPRCYLDAATVHRRTLQANDILIETAGGNWDRPTGRTFLVTQRLLDSLDLPATCASFCRYMRVDPEKADPRYVFWYLQYLYSRGEMWEHQVQHTGVARFQYTRFAESTQVPLPHRAVQCRTADILGSLDDKIELNRRMNETLEAMARALFKSWFVDFDPVHAKAAVRREHPKWTNAQVSRAALPNLDPAVAELFPDSFEESALGLIPAGWKVGRVGQQFNLTMGQSPPGSTYNELGDGLPFFQGRRDFGFRFPACRVYCTEPTRFAEPGDSLVSVRAPVGDLNMARERCCIGRGVAAVRHRTESRSYTYYAMHGLSEHFARYEAEGTVFGCINKESFQALTFPAADDSLIMVFERIAYPLDQTIENLTRESAQLIATRDALLPRLLSGELCADTFQGAQS